MSRKTMFTTLRTSVLALSAIASIGVATLVAASTPAEARPGFVGRPGAAFTRFTSTGSTLQRHPGAAFTRFSRPGSTLQRHPGAAFIRFSRPGSTLQRHPGAAFTRFSRPGSTAQQHPGAANGMNNGCRFGRCNNYAYRPYINGAPAVAATYAPAPGYAAPAPTYAAAPAPTCAAAPAATTCLRKQYTQDGQVVFSDICTNEAVAGPAGQQLQAQAPPQQ